MNEDFTFAFIEISEKRHDFLEVLFLFLQYLILGFASEIQDLDHFLEFRSADKVLVVLKKLGMDELLIVEFGDLLLRINLDILVIIPVFACQLFEQLVFQLASSRFCLLLSFRKIERQCQHLLTITGVEI